MDFVLKKWMLLLLFEQPKQIVVTTFFNLTPVWNNGISFGLMSSQPEGSIYYSDTCIACHYLFDKPIKVSRVFTAVSSAIISGGAVGNVIDRILYGKVVDFLDFHIGGYHWQHLI